MVNINILFICPNKGQLSSGFVPTCLHDVLQRWEAFADSGADGAEDQDRRQVGVPHEGPTQQATPVVDAVHVSRHHHHQVVRQREAGVLTPPTGEGLVHVETWTEQDKEIHFMFKSTGMLMIRKRIRDTEKEKNHFNLDFCFLRI